LGSAFPLGYRPRSLSRECPGESLARVTLVAEVSLKAALTVVGGVGSSLFVNMLTAPVGFAAVVPPPLSFLVCSKVDTLPLRRKTQF